MHSIASDAQQKYISTEDTNVKKRFNRQDAIRQIVREKSIKTQRALVEELEELGFVCTQATISRDIADMGLRKLPEGVYVLAEDLHLQRMVSTLVTGVVRANNIVVIHSQAGTAQGGAKGLPLPSTMRACPTSPAASRGTTPSWLSA